MKAILAVDEMGGLAYKGSLPWRFGHYENDAIWFKNHTRHKTVIMGRKTFQSFTGRRSTQQEFDLTVPLRDRTNIVVTSDADIPHQEPMLQIRTFNSIVDDIRRTDVNTRDYWVIGGKQLISSFFDVKVINEFYLSVLPGFHLADIFWMPSDIDRDMARFGLFCDWETTLQSGEHFKIYKKL